MKGRNAQVRHDPLDPATSAADLKARVEAVAAIAAAEANAVDAEARLPAAAIEALRKNRLLGLLVPIEFGGEDVGFGEVAEACYRLGQACSATAMIFAMHHSAAACVIRHGKTSAWHKNLFVEWPTNNCWSLPPRPKDRMAARSRQRRTDRTR